MKLMARILIAIVACMLIMTGCQRAAKQEIVVSGEVIRRTDSKNENIRRIEITGEVNSIEEGYF